MSHPAAWACRSCGLVLGEVRGGALRPLVPVASVDGRGVARVPCPACGRVRAWSPDGAPAAAPEGGSFADPPGVPPASVVGGGAHAGVAGEGPFDPGPVG
jgi:hypothetical protein